MVYFYFESIEPFSLDTKFLTGWIEDTISTENHIPADISVILCSDDYLLNINQQYLNHDYFTDVITFDYSSGNIVSGDIFISTDMVKVNAESIGVSFNHELKRIIIHGVLHLLGYKDKSDSDKKVMTSKEDEYLNKLDDVDKL